MPVEPTGGLHPSAVLAAYAEPLVRGRRVAVLGDVSIDLALRLEERGARLIHAYDPDPSRVAEALARAARGGAITYAVLAADLGVRDGAFDVVIVADLSVFDDAGEVVRRARRLTGSGGVALFGSPNPAGASLFGARSGRRPAPGYYDLYDLVSLQYSNVTMVGQAPFVGYTVAEFAPESEPSVSVDTSLLSASEEPEWFIAIGSERDVDLEPYAVIELPTASFDALPARTQAVDDDRAALVETRARLELMGAELEKLRDAKNEDRARREGEHANAASVAARAVALERELEAATEGKRSVERRAQDVERRAQDADARAHRAVQALGEAKQAFENERNRAAALVVELDAARKARARSDAEIGALRASVDDAATKLAAHAARAAELEARPGDESTAADVDALERALRERGLRVTELESDLRESERIGRELLADLEHARIERVTAPATTEASSKERAPSRADFDALAVKAAKAEADAQAAAWRVADLERRVADAEVERTEPDVARLHLEQALIAARRELSELRARLDRGPFDGGGRAAADQAVLLDQVAGSRDPALARGT